jgi:hypothetical protein
MAAPAPTHVARLRRLVRGARAHPGHLKPIRRGPIGAVRDPTRTIMPVMKAPSQPAPKRPSGKTLKAAIVRSIASSTAIETGQRVDNLERLLRSGRSKFAHLKLAR